jgi:hypothetical protein
VLPQTRKTVTQLEETPTTRRLDVFHHGEQAWIDMSTPDGRSRRIASGSRDAVRAAARLLSMETLPPLMPEGSPLRDEIQTRRSQWRRNRVVGIGILVELDNGRALARWFEQTTAFIAQTFEPFEESLHATAEEAERWCMERV